MDADTVYQERQRALLLEIDRQSALAHTRGKALKLLWWDAKDANTLVAVRALEQRLQAMA